MPPHRWQPTRLPRPWDSPGKNTGVGCHFLFQCLKVKSKVKSLSHVRLLATPWTEWSKSEKQISYTNGYIRNLERWCWWTYLKRSNGDRTDVWTRLAGEEGEAGMYGEDNMKTYITICKIDYQWEFDVWLRELKPGLGNNVEGWDGKGGVRDVQVGGDMGKPMADSCWSLVKTNTIL